MFEPVLTQTHLHTV